MSTDGNHLALAIRMSEMTQRALADAIGVDEAVISRYVHGLAVPKQRREEIAAALGLSPSQLWPAPEGVEAG